MNKLSASMAHRLPNVRLLALVLAYLRIHKRMAEQMELPMEAK